MSTRFKDSETDCKRLCKSIENHHERGNEGRFIYVIYLSFISSSGYWKCESIAIRKRNEQ